MLLYRLSRPLATFHLQSCPTVFLSVIPCADYSARTVACRTGVCTPWPHPLVRLSRLRAHHVLPIRAASVYHGTGVGYEFYLVCIPQYPKWVNASVPELPFNSSLFATFPSDFRFTVNGTAYSRVGFNRYSAYSLFIPDGTDPSTFYRELTTPTYYGCVDDAVPLAWMKVSPATGNLVRLFCAWCDQYDPNFGNTTHQFFSGVGSRVYRINANDFHHLILSPVKKLSAQVSFYESTGAVKIHYVERSVEDWGHGAMGVQLTTDSALNIPNINLATCPQGADVIYTPRA